MTPAILATIAPVLAVLVGVMGLLIGSFLNVVVYRTPNGLSVVRPASACPACGHEIRGYDNVPVISWLVLRGRCRDCAAPISVRYPLVELVTGLAFAGVVLWQLPQLLAAATPSAAFVAGWSLQLVAFLHLAAITIALSAIDLDTHRLPDAIVLPSYLVGIGLLVPAALLLGSWQPLAVAAIGAAAMFVVYFAAAVIKPGGMGLGDVKLAGVLGLWLGYLGWAQLAVGFLAGFLIGALVGVALMLGKRIGWKGGIPFGPSMFAGAWVGVFLGQPIADAYLSITGLA